MKLYSSLWRRTGQIVITLMLMGLILSVFLPILRPDSQAASASRARVYGFRHTDGKLVTEWISRLGMKVTVDKHSASVIVLTSDDPAELAKAYSLAELSDCNQPMQYKSLGAIADSEAKSTLEILQKKLKDKVPGTLMDPPTRSSTNAMIVDIYRGELVVFGRAAEITATEKALQSLQPKAEPTTTEPNKPVTKTETQAAAKKAEPNEPVVAAEAQAVEPNVKSAVQVEPNAVAVEVKTIEPNQVAESTQTSEDFISEELLKTLADEEQNKQQDVQEVVAEVTQPEAVMAEQTEPNVIEPVEAPAAELPVNAEAIAPVEPNTTEPNTADGEVQPVEMPAVEEIQPIEAPVVETPVMTEVNVPADVNAAQAAEKQEFETIIAQLRKQSQEDEKKAAEEQASVEPNQVKAPVETKPAKTKAAKTKKSADDKVKSAAADKAVGTDKMEEELEVTITMPEKVEVQQLIELVGKQLGLNYIYDPTQVTGNVTLKIHDGKIKVKDCYALLESVLRFRGLVMTRRGNLVTIVPQAQSGQLADPKLRKEGEPIEAGDVIVSSVFELRYASLNSVNNLLQRIGLGQNPPPILVPETNTLIVTDYANRMPKIEEVIRIIDTPGIKKYVHRQLNYMQASELLPRLQKLASQLQNLNITVGSTSPTAMPVPAVRTPGQPAQPQPQPQLPQQVVPQDQITVYLDADERTNRVLMIGNEEQITVVNSLIDSLDVKQYNLQYVKEYDIKNVDAGEVISALNELGLAKVSIASKTTTTSTMPQSRTPGQPVTPQQQQQQQALAQVAGAAGEAGGDQPFISIRPNTNSLLVNATSEQHERIELVIKYIDVEQKDQRTIKEYEIQNIDASEVVTTLGDLGVISSQSVSSITTSKDSMYGGSTGSGSRYGSGYGSQYGTGTNRTMQNMQGMQGQPGVEQQSTATNLITAEGTEKDLTAAEPKISILESTNSLLVHATPRQHASVALVIAYVDRQLDQASTPYVVYPLENQKPEDLRTTLEGLIQESLDRAAKKTTAGAQDPRLVTTQQPTTGGESNLPIQQAEKIKIIDDKASNSLIVYANKKNQQWISDLIHELDQYRPQVLLDCTLVEITKDDQFTFDLDFVLKKGGFPDGGTMTKLTPIVTPFSPGTVGEATVTKGTGAAYYSDSHIQALLNLVDKNNYGRVLARPSLLVKDNEEGIIKAEKLIYVAEEKTNIQSQDQGEAIQTTDVTFKEYKSDITLTITPHISSEKILGLEIVLNRTDFDLSSGNEVEIRGETIPKPYDQVISNIDTWSVIPDGATIILGGIEQVNQGKTNTKVPILGDIPLVGLLFRGIDQTDKQSKLYVFVKANIIKPGDELTGQSDIEKVSQKKRKAFEEEESRFQNLDSVPGLKPNPIHPKKVLENDEYIEELKKESQSDTPTVTVQIE